MAVVLAGGLTVAFAANSPTAPPPVPTAPAGVSPVTYQQEGVSTFSDASTGELLTCAAGSLSLIPVSGGPITAFSLSDCTDSAGLGYTVTAVGLPYAHSQSSDGASEGVITGFALAVQGPTCSAMLTGTVGAGYNPTTNTATIMPDGDLLTVKAISSTCQGILNTGDVINFTSVWG